MTDQHPITPPPELVKQWLVERHHHQDYTKYPISQAARWGYGQAIKELEAFLEKRNDQSPITELAQKIADQELEACCDVIARELNDFDGEYIAGDLRADRRPKPPSLKEQALAALTTADGADYLVVSTVITADEHAIIRRALEQLPDDQDRILKQ